MNKTVLSTCLLLAVASGGCSESLRLGPPHDYEKPAVAVSKFDNRAGGHAAGNVGDGASEILVDRLLATGRYQVVERADLNAVRGEMRLQKSGETREQARATPGRFKNVQYVIKGAVTDFGLVEGQRGSFGLAGFSIAGGGTRAVFGINVQVVDVESGEIVFSKSIQDSVSAGDASARAGVKGASIGSSTFRRTPLGQATEKVIDRAVKEITLAVASRPWTPKVAEVRSDGVVLISGGADRRVTAGGEYEVIEPGKPVLDPATGDLIGRGAGAIVARLRVARVWAGYSETALVEGSARDLRVGQACRKSEAVASR